ncbi:hypothetical protein ACIPUB_13210 [Paeniglutamicibacter sp. ORCA_105]|uniref:hypothetical protein n=1 Tax=Paeniglutamicibacter sp. ORCA_105 TaxID=3377336 RepID=UPI0038939EE8
MIPERWVPGTFAAGLLMLCLRGTRGPSDIELQIDGHLRRVAQAQVLSAATAVPGFPLS